MKTDWEKQRKAFIEGCKSRLFTISEWRQKEILEEMRKTEEAEKQ